MSNTPPWATSSAAGGFTPPKRDAATPAAASTPSSRPFPPELRQLEKSTGRIQKAPRKSPLVTVLLLILVVALVAAAGVLAFKALVPQDVSALVPKDPASVSHAADGKAVGATGKQAIALKDTDPQANGQATTMTTATMGPNTLFIPALGVYMPLEADSTFIASRYSGFDTIEVPTNPHYGVVYGAGAPLYGGSEGTTLVASHVSQASGWGALRYLYTMTGGELIWTKDASGRLQEWQLTSMRVEEHTNFPQEYWSKTGTRRLVVVTCGGRISSGHYDKNVFAIAKPIDSKGDSGAGTTTPS